MNRYVIDGIVRDLQAGKRIALLGPTRSQARSAFLDVCTALVGTHVRLTCLSEGREQLVSHKDGRLNVITPESVRGMNFDILVTIDWEPEPLPVHPDVLPALAPDSELLRACA